MSEWNSWVHGGFPLYGVRYRGDDLVISSMGEEERLHGRACLYKLAAAAWLAPIHHLVMSTHAFVSHYSFLICGFTLRFSVFDHHRGESKSQEREQKYFHHLLRVSVIGYYWLATRYHRSGRAACLCGGLLRNRDLWPKNHIGSCIN